LPKHSYLFPAGNIGTDPHNVLPFYYVREEKFR